MSTIGFENLMLGSLQLINIDGHISIVNGQISAKLLGWLGHLY